MPVLKMKSKNANFKKKKKKVLKKKILKPHEMPEILKIFANYKFHKFYKITFVNLFEKTGNFTFTKEFSELKTVSKMKEFLQKKIYQKSSKISIYKKKENQLEELEDSMKISTLSSPPIKELQLFFKYKLPKPFIHNRI